MRSGDPSYRGRQQSRQSRDSESLSQRRVPSREPSANSFSQSQSRNSISRYGTLHRDSTPLVQTPLNSGNNSQHAQTQSQTLFRSQFGQSQPTMSKSNSKSSLKTYISKREVAMQVTPKRMVDASTNSCTANTSDQETQTLETRIRVCCTSFADKND